MESGVPATAPVILIGLLRLKKKSTETKNIMGKIAKSRQIRKFPLAMIPILAKLYSMTLCLATRKIGIFRILS